MGPFSKAISHRLEALADVRCRPCVRSSRNLAETADQPIADSSIGAQPGTAGDERGRGRGLPRGQPGQAVLRLVQRRQVLAHHGPGAEQGRRRRSDHVPYKGSPPALHEVPTFAEQGYAMLDDVARMGLWIKHRVPGEVQKKIRHATRKVMSQPAVVPTPARAAAGRACRGLRARDQSLRAAIAQARRPPCAGRRG